MFLVRCTKRSGDFEPGLVYRSRLNREISGSVHTIRIQAGHIEPSEEGSDEHGDYPVGDDGTYQDIPLTEFPNHFEWYRALVLQPNEIATVQVEIILPDVPERRLEVDAAPGLAVSARPSGTSEPYVSLHSNGMDLSDYPPGVPVKFDLEIAAAQPLSKPQSFPSPRCVVTSSGPSGRND